MLRCCGQFGQRAKTIHVFGSLPPDLAPTAKNRAHEFRVFYTVERGFCCLCYFFVSVCMSFWGDELFLLLTRQFANKIRKKRRSQPPPSKHFPTATSLDPKIAWHTKIKKNYHVAPKFKRIIPRNKAATFSFLPLPLAPSLAPCK